MNVPSYRGPGLQGKELQLLIEAVEDRIAGVTSINPRITAEGCLPLDTPGLRALIVRDIQRTVNRVENRIKLALYPRRKTNLAQNPREVYEDRVKYGSGGLDSFLTPEARTFPEWQDLTPEQRAAYQNDPDLYTPGTLPWPLLTREQRERFSREVIYVPHKVGDEERIDGRNRQLIKLFNRNVIKIYKIALEIQDPQGLGIPYLHRTYAPGEYFLYPKSGEIILYPAQAKLAATGAHAGSVASAGYGLIVPGLPQIITVDYEFGLLEIPYDLQDAIAMLAAIRIFEHVNAAFTRGLLSMSVQGFSASFGAGMYAEVMARYRREAEEILAPYFHMIMTGQ